MSIEDLLWGVIMKDAIQYMLNSIPSEWLASNFHDPKINKFYMYKPEVSDKDIIKNEAMYSQVSFEYDGPCGYDAVIQETMSAYYQLNTWAREAEDPNSKIALHFKNTIYVDTLPETDVIKREGMMAKFNYNGNEYLLPDNRFALTQPWFSGLFFVLWDYCSTFCVINKTTGEIGIVHITIGKDDDTVTAAEAKRWNQPNELQDLVKSLPNSAFDGVRTFFLNDNTDKMALKIISKKVFDIVKIENLCGDINSPAGIKPIFDLV